MKTFFLILISSFLIKPGLTAQIPVKDGAGLSSVNASGFGQVFPQDTTRKLVALVNEAAALIRLKGEAAFDEFRLPESHWRWGETYIFILDPEGNMLVHEDADMEGKNQFYLKDINGKPIVRGLIEAATSFPDKPNGWYHYQWPVPGGLLPRWKSSYVQMVKAPSGKRYIVGSGMYNDRMEREFVVDMVNDAVGQIEKNGTEAYKLFRDPKGSFMVKDAYVFVIDRNGIDLVNPGFPNLEGRNVLDLKDTHGKYLMRDMFSVVTTSGSGSVDYMWPKPGESISTQKSTFVRKAKMGDEWVLVGCGVYLADAPKASTMLQNMTASDLMMLVRSAAAVFEERGEHAFPEFREQGSRWLNDHTYFFVWTTDGVRYFHAVNPTGEGVDMRGIKDVQGRPWGKMFLDAASTVNGEGWVHYMYPEPGDIFPTWKSSFLKRVTFPSGTQYIIGCGIYNMQMDKAFIEDVVNQAVTLIKEHGWEAFKVLRDKTGPFVFMDTYVFVDDLYGTELVNPGHPGIEGKNLMNVTDLNGKFIVREYIETAMKNGSAWVDYYWYKPGENIPALKHTFVRTVEAEGKTYIVGAGFYSGDAGEGE